MSPVGIGSGHRHSFSNRLSKILATTAVAVVLGAGAWIGPTGELQAGGETRTISLYHIHTKESLTVTYMVNGRYVPSALSKINYLLRDWRRNEVINIDPKTIDLIWDLHADLGSQQPIHIVCGYRSPKTNAFLKRIGRNVARKSQHMVGKAIDLFFPDVSTEKVRNSALVREVGGVGYYPRSGGPMGFVHLDSARVRHWGPSISAFQMARIFQTYRKTIGARLNRDDQLMMASAKSGKGQPSAAASLASAYEGVDEEADDVATPARKPAIPKAKPALAAPEPTQEVAEAAPVPRPRPKPIEVLMMAAVNMTIEPASAPPPRINFAEKPKPVAGSLGVVAGAESMAEEPPPSQETNAGAKGSFADELRAGTAENTPMIKPLAASASGEDLFWWPKQLIFSPDREIRRDGAPQEFTVASEPLESADQPPIVVLESASGETFAGTAVAATMPASTAKADRLEVNRSAKGSLLMEIPVVWQNRQKLGQLQDPTGVE